MRRATFLGACCALAAGAASAAEVALTPVRDNTLYQEYPSNSNGAGYLYAGRAGGGGIRRALLRFDVAGALPPGAHVDAVRLELHVSRTNVADPLPATLHRALADWGEAGSNAGERAGSGTQAQPGDTTWSHRFYDTVVWSSDGGEFAPASATGAIGGIGTHVLDSTPELVADVQGWLDAPAANYGWVLRGDESAAGDARRIDSREAAAAVRPRLVVAFTAPAPVPLPRGVRAFLAALGLAPLFARARKPKPLGR